MAPPYTAVYKIIGQKNTLLVSTLSWKFISIRRISIRNEIYKFKITREISGEI